MGMSRRISCRHETYLCTAVCYRTWPHSGCVLPQSSCICVLSSFHRRDLHEMAGITCSQATP